MSTTLITRISSGPFVESVKNAPLNNSEVDSNFITLAENKLERENNLADIINTTDARGNLGVPNFEGSGAFGLWGISVTGNSGTATALQNPRSINDVFFDGTEDITITAETDNPLLFGNGLSSSSGFDGSTTLTVTVDGDVVVLRTGNQTIDGTKTFNSAVEIETQATSPNHAVVGSREFIAGNGLQGGGNLTNDVTFDIDDAVVVVTSNTNQSIDGDKTFQNAVTLNTPGTAVTHAVRGDRSINPGDGINGGGNLSSDREFSVDESVIRDFGDQTIGGIKTFSSSPVLLSSPSGLLDAVRADRVIETGSGLEGGGNLVIDRTLSVDASVVRTSGPQTLSGTKQFVEAVVLNTQGESVDEALAAGRTITTGDGLNGGGDLTTDRTLSVDSTVVRTDRDIQAGDGLDGGGDLSTNRSFSVDSSVVRTSRQILTGDGLDGGGDLSSTRQISVDGTVVRTTGSQEIEGEKSFLDTVTFDSASSATFNGSITVNDTSDFTDVVTFTNPPVMLTSGINPNEAVRADRELTPGDGLTGGGDLTADRSFSVDASVVRTSRQIITGDGLNGGDDFAQDLTLSVDDTVIRDSRIITAGDGLTGGGDLSTDISLNVTDITQISLTETQEITVSDTSNYENLIIGEKITGQTSGAEGILFDVNVLTDDVQLIVRLLDPLTTFEETGETIVGEDSNESISSTESSSPVSEQVDELRSDGEVIDFLPSSNENIENVVDIPNALDKVLAIGGKLFDWNADHLGRRGGTDGYHVVESDFGVVAEDVQSVFPQGVRQKVENGELVVDYRKLFALAFAAIKELNDKIP